MSLIMLIDNFTIKVVLQCQLLGKFTLNLYVNVDDVFTVMALDQSR